MTRYDALSDRELVEWYAEMAEEWAFERTGHARDHLTWCEMAMGWRDIEYRRTGPTVETSVI